MSVTEQVIEQGLLAELAVLSIARVWAWTMDGWVRSRERNATAINATAGARPVNLLLGRKVRLSTSTMPEISTVGNIGYHISR